MVTTIEGMSFVSVHGARKLTLDEWLAAKPSQEQFEQMLDFAHDSMVRAGWTDAQQFVGQQTIYSLIVEAIERLKAEGVARNTKH